MIQQVEMRRLVGIGLGEVAAEVRAATFLTIQRRRNHQSSHQQQVLQFPPLGDREFLWPDVPIPEFDLMHRRFQIHCIPFNPHLPPHLAVE